MPSAFHRPSRRPDVVRRLPEVVLLASLLAFGVVAWAHLLHACSLGQGAPLTSHLSHALRDGLLTLPLALVAVLGGRWLAQRLGLRHPSGRALLGRAGVISLLFALLLVPSVGIHHHLDTALAGAGRAAVPAERLASGGVWGRLLHGAQVALVGQAAALPLALLGLALVTLVYGASPWGEPGTVGRQRRRWAHFALPLAPTGAVLLLLGALLPLLGGGLSRNAGIGPAQAAQATVDFEATDEPGPWFTCVSGTGCVPPSLAGTHALAVVQPGDTVRISVGAQTNTVHTFTSLLFPTGAPGMPFDQPSAFRGTREVTLRKAGLYVFVCKLHPFMLGAVIADDPDTPELDLGERITLLTGLTVPTASDLALRLVRAFFVITNPANWQVFDPSGPSTWDPVYAPVPVRAFDANRTPVALPNLDGFLQGYFNEPVTLPASIPPSTRGVGEVWVDTEYETTGGKTKPGTVTAVDTGTWRVTKKVALPQINMNNPHNMWTDRDQRVIYQTQWFDTKLTVFDRVTGALVQNIEVGESPAHVMTRVDTDQVHVTLNGEDAVVELAPLATQIDRIIPVQFAREHPAQPHAHWMSFDGHTMVTPNSNTNDSTILDIPAGTIDAKSRTGVLPIASGMMPDVSKYYVSNYLDSTITCVSIGAPACRDGRHRVALKQINLLAHYHPLTGAITAPGIGALPIQTPVSPHGKYVLTANTLTGTVTIIDTATDTLVKVLPCDAGCHGVNFGAKRGGGYYAYVSSKFSNRLIVVDPDPNHDGDPSDAAIAGSVVLVAGPHTRMDDHVTAYAGMGGQGVLPIPLVYHGWVQNLPPRWKARLTADQLKPFPLP
jgi:DNA-binding beta-propeller fold protein YncE